MFVETEEANGFRLTAAMLEKAITPRTKLLIINSPSNPSGAVLSREEFEKIFHLTSSRGIWLLTDECYCQFLYADTPFSIASLKGAKDTVVVAGSLSKTYAMTGWRVGFTLAPAAVVGAITKLQSHCTSNPTSIAQKAGVEALRGPQDSVKAMLNEYRSRRDYVVSRLRQIPGVKLAEPMGAFYAYPNVSVAFPERNREFARFRRQAAVGRVRGGGTGRSIRHQRSHPHQLRHIDARARAGTRPAGQVHRREELMAPVFLEPSFREKVWGTPRLSPLYPDADSKVGEVWFEFEPAAAAAVQVHLHFGSVIGAGAPQRRVRAGAREFARQDRDVAHPAGGSRGRRSPSDCAAR